MNPALDGLATHQAVYRFFDTEFVIRSDSSEIIARFDQVYGRFRVSGTVPRALVCHVLAGDRPFGGPALVLDGKTHLINDPDILADYAHTSILNAALSQVRTHFLIHGAALSAACPEHSRRACPEHSRRACPEHSRRACPEHSRRDGVGLLLAGHAGCGKTTLALELVRRGFRFLSDDIAAIACANHYICPFPRSLGLWPGTRQLIPEAGGLPRRTAGKQLVDIEAIYPHRLGESCLLQYLVVLTSRRGEPERVGEALYVTVDRVSESLLAELSAIPEVGGVTVFEAQRLPVIKLLLSRRAVIEPAIEDVCVRHQVLIFDVAREGDHPPDFDASPHLESLPKAEATLELLRRLRGGMRSALLRHEFQGSATRLYLALSEVAAKTVCYRLLVGQLRDMADLICRVVEGDHVEAGLSQAGRHGERSEAISDLLWGLLRRKRRSSP